MNLSANSVVLGGVKVDVLSRKGWADQILLHCQSVACNQGGPKLVFAANCQVIALCATDPSFRATFEQADAVTADGQPLVWASRLTRYPLPERAATTDLFHDVARVAQAHNLTFFLLGATERNVSIAEAEIRRAYPRLRIVGYRNGYFGEQEEAHISASINELCPNILWIGLGAKQQASFAVRNVDRLGNVGCIMTCGGLFDYFTPEVRRAPVWMQKMALEWLFRTWQQPRQYVWRYLVTNPVAALLLLTRTRSA